MQDVIKIEINTDQVKDPIEAWQPKGLEASLGISEFTETVSKVPFIGDKIAGGLNAMTTGLTSSMKTIGEIGQGASPTQILAMVGIALTLARKAFDKGQEIYHSYKQSEEMRRRAYGDRE